MTDLDLDQWLGWSETAAETAEVGPVAGMAALLDYDRPPPAAGDEVPAGWHWLYFTEKTRGSALAADGLPKSGRNTLPLPLPRRMFGGARMRFLAPIRVGERLRAEFEVIGARERAARSGRLVVLTLRQRIHGDSGLAVEEEQDILYREAAAAGEADAAAPPPGLAWRGDWTRTVTPDPVTLFRFSALLFNSHRIHYDRPYATGVEGYPGLVVHGPLIALLLLEACKAENAGRQVIGFRFRAQAPLYDLAPFTLTGRLAEDGRTCALAALGPEGGVAMAAEADLA